MNIFLDFETRCDLDLRTTSISKYAKHPSCQQLLLAYSTPEGTIKQWAVEISATGYEEPPIPEDLAAMVADPKVVFHAHNATFERYIWEHVSHKQLGWPRIDIGRWRCTALKAAYAGQPRSLEMVAQRLGLSEQKMKLGKLLIALFCNGKKVFPVGDTANWESFKEYNRQDVITEMAVDAELPKVSEEEYSNWVFDAEINDRGFYVDVDLCQSGKVLFEQAKVEANLLLLEMTGIPRTTMIKRIKEWIISKGVNLGESLTEQIVDQLVADPSTPPEVKLALELRKSTNSNTVTKYATALDYVEDDQRVRNSLLFYGASTGRWAGRGFHPHNFKRSSIPAEEQMLTLSFGDYDTVRDLATGYGYPSVISMLKSCVRGIICAPKGRKLVISDFAGIEARVLHWLCGNDRMTKMFREDQDIYIDSACSIFKVKPEEMANWDETRKKWKVKPDAYIGKYKCSEMRQVGKQAQLGLGYGMGPKAFAANVKKAEGLELSEDFALEVVQAWRSQNHLVAKFWYALDDAMKAVIRGRSGQDRQVGPIRICRHTTKDYMVIILPSGKRGLFYFRPTVKTIAGYEVICYLDGAKKDIVPSQKAHAGQYGIYEPTNTPYWYIYGGKATENIVQAISRDLLLNSMRLISQAGYDLVFSVHDESVSEVPEEDIFAKDIIHRCMSTIPPWAKGLPLAAETNESKRYGK